jgi:two-component system response regulator FixJ
MGARMVYVIDDDPAVLDSTAFLLASLGYKWNCFADARDFLDGVDERSPGCVITDLRMPEMNGYELQRALHERSVAWPVVLMTSENGSLGTDKAAERGFSGYLRKPFSTDELVAALETCFAKLEGRAS